MNRLLFLLKNYHKLLDLFHAIGIFFAVETSTYFGQGDVNWRYQAEYATALRNLQKAFEPFKDKEYYQYQNFEYKKLLKMLDEEDQTK